MAFYDDELDDQQQQAAPGQDASAPGQQISGESSVVTGQNTQGTTTAGTGEQPAGSSPQTTTTPFVGINEYLAANKPQTEKLAQNISGYVSGLGDTARSAISQGQEQYNQAVGQNTVSLNQGLVDQAKNQAETLTDEQKDEFKRMRDAQYSGPTSFQTSQYYQPVSQAVTAAQKAAANTSDLEGLKQVAAGYQQQNRGRINQGAATFDASLLSSDEQARQTLANTRAGMEDLPSLLEAAQTDAAAKSAAGAQTTASTRQAIQDTFGGENSVQKQLEKRLTDQAAAAQGQAKKDAEATLAALKGGQQLTDAQLALMGVSRADFDKLVGDRGYYTSNWNKQLTDTLDQYGTLLSPEAQINAQNVASAQDYARYAALNDLMGVQNQFLSDASLAGTANMDVLDYNQAGAQGNIDSIVSNQRRADAQAAEEARLAKERADAKAAREAEEQATLTGAGIGFAVGGPVGAVVGAVIGNAICFARNTPIKMADGSFKLVQDLDIGDMTYKGGMVLGAGKALTGGLVEYKGQYTSPKHAIFDGVSWKRADQLNDVLEVQTIVHPIVTENHILISDNGVVYADLIEHDDAIGMSDEDKLNTLNSPEYVKKTKELEQEINGNYDVYRSALLGA